MEQTSTPLSPAETLLTWQAPIMPNHERTQRWYIVAGISVIAMIAYGILSGAWSFAIVMMLCAGLYFALRDHKHGNETIQITTLGVTIRSRFLRWEDISGYWLLDTPEYSELHITPKDTRVHELKIQTGNQPRGTLKDVLNQFVPELTNAHESLIDFCIRICKL